MARSTALTDGFGPEAGLDPAGYRKAETNGSQAPCAVATSSEGRTRTRSRGIYCGEQTVAKRQQSQVLRLAIQTQTGRYRTDVHKSTFPGSATEEVSESSIALDHPAVSSHSGDSLREYSAQIGARR